MATAYSPTILIGSTVRTKAVAEEIVELSRTSHARCEYEIKPEPKGGFSIWKTIDKDTQYEEFMICQSNSPRLYTDGYSKGHGIHADTRNCVYCHVNEKDL